MDNPVQEYEFLDLSDLDEVELSQLRTVLGTNPQQQGLSLPWSEAAPPGPLQGAGCPGPEPDGPCDWADSSDLSYAVTSLAPPPPPPAFLPPPFFGGGPPSCPWLQPVPAGEPVNGGGHMDIPSEIEVSCGSESPHDDINQGNPPQVVATSAPAQARLYTQTGPPPSDHNAMYSNVYVNHPYTIYAHHPPVTNYQMMSDVQQQPPQQTQQGRGRGRKSMNKSRESMGHGHGQDMMAHPMPIVDGYPGSPQFYPMPYYHPVHQPTGSPIYQPYHVYPMYPQQMEYSPRPVTVPMKADVPVPVPHQAPKAAYSAPVPVSPAIVPTPALQPPPTHVPVPLVPEAAAVLIQSPAVAAPAPAPVPVPILEAAQIPAAPVAVSPTECPAPVAQKVSDKPPPAMKGPPAGAVAIRRPAATDPKKAVVPKTEALPAAQQQQQQQQQPLQQQQQQPLQQQQQQQPVVQQQPPPPQVQQQPPLPLHPPPQQPPLPPPQQLPPLPPPQQQQPPPPPQHQPEDEKPAATAAQPPEPAAPAPAPAPAAPTPAPTPAPAPAPALATVTWAKKLFSKDSPSQPSYSNAATPPTGMYTKSGPPDGLQSPAAPQPAQRPARESASFPTGPAPALPPPNPTDDPKLYQLSEFLHRYKLEHKAVSLLPRGLTNRNNWCYINATLQALLACPPFYNLLRSLPFDPSNRPPSESRIPIIESMKHFVNEFTPLGNSARLKRSDRAARSRDGDAAATGAAACEITTGNAFEPSFVYRMLSAIRSDAMVEGRQEDAEEFLSCLLNGLNDEMLELMKLTPDLPNGDISNSISANGETQASAQGSQSEDDEWKVMGPKNKGSITRRADFGRTPLSDIFRGQLRSRVVRQNASDSVTDNVQPFFTLQLDIEKVQSVKKALEQYVQRDQLEGVTCSRSNQEVMAWQEVQLEELPPVLLLHLKWFDYRQDGCSKICKNIQYEIDLKVDSKLLSSKKAKTPNQLQYKLFAVVYHDGKEATKGHYITDAFHVGYGSWIRYDDSVVKVVSPAMVTGARAPRVPYLLYYRRQDTIIGH